MNTRAGLVAVGALLLAVGHDDGLHARATQTVEAGVVRITSASPDGQQRVGSGFVVALVDGSAYIVTASHVVEGDKQPQVEFYSRPGQPVAGTLVRVEGGNPRGLALLSVPADLRPLSSVSVLAPAFAAPLVKGEQVLAVGMNRATRPWAIVRGTVVNQVGRDVIFSPAVPEGFSGGPLVRDDQVVGVVVETTPTLAHALPRLSIELFVASVLSCLSWADADLIAELLDRFTAATASLNVDQFQDVYPDLPTAYRSTFEQLRSWTVDLRCREILFNADGVATVTCDATERLVYRDGTGENHPKVLTFALRRRDDCSWYIERLTE